MPPAPNRRLSRAISLARVGKGPFLSDKVLGRPEPSARKIAAQLLNDGRLAGDKMPKFKTLEQWTLTACSPAHQDAPGTPRH